MEINLIKALKTRVQKVTHMTKRGECFDKLRTIEMRGRILLIMFIIINLKASYH